LNEDKDVHYDLDQQHLETYNEIDMSQNQPTG